MARMQLPDERPQLPHTHKAHDTPHQADAPHGQDANVDNEILPQPPSEPAFLQLALLSREQNVCGGVCERCRANVAVAAAAAGQERILVLGRRRGRRVRGEDDGQRGPDVECDDEEDGWVLVVSDRSNLHGRSHPTAIVAMTPSSSTLSARTPPMHAKPTTTPHMSTPTHLDALFLSAPRSTSRAARMVSRPRRSHMVMLHRIMMHMNTRAVLTQPSSAGRRAKGDGPSGSR
jgi:hypothetical protein